VAYVSAEERRRQLTEAAVRVVRRDGVRGLTTRKVAEEAGAPLASIHYAFGTKEDLVEAAIRTVIDDMVGPVIAAVDTEQGLATAIRSLVEAYWRALTEGHLPELVFSDLFAVGDDRAKRFARAEYDRYRSLTEDMLRTAVEAEGVPPAVPVEQLARLLVLCTDGVLMQYALDEDSERAEADLQAVGEALIALAAAAVPGPRAGARPRRRR
jgi:AcrR family transcriptional regulator